MSDNQSWDSGAGVSLLCFGAILMMLVLFAVQWMGTAGDVMVIDGQHYVNVGQSIGSNSRSNGDWFEFDPDQPITFIKVVDE